MKVGMPRSLLGELSVETRKILVPFAITVLLSAIFLLPPAFSQESPTKRKVSHRVVPEYPTLARQMNITGKVKIEVTVAPDGHVKATRSVGGSPLLLDAATRAVKSWKFEVGPKETTEIVEFDFTPQQ
jgi:TonB family protein